MPPPAEGFASRFVLAPALRTQPDRRLVMLVRQGYELAFEEIVRRYGRALSRYAASIVGGRSEDVTQDAFSKALLALRRDGAEIELRPWLFRIVRNTALNDLRDRPPSPEALAEAIAGGRNPAEELERREELAELIRHLRALPEPQRAAIVMRELEGLGHDEIAAALGVSGGAARQAIYRARRALRDGAGMVLPLPLLKALLSGGTPSGAEAAAGAAGVGGAGVALKATAATVLVAGAVGTGVVLDHGPRTVKAEAEATPRRADSTAAPLTAPPRQPSAAALPADRRGSRGESHPRSGGPGGRAKDGAGSSGRGGGHRGDAPRSRGADGGPATSHSDSPGRGGGSGDSGHSGEDAGGSATDGSRSGPGGGSQPDDGAGGGQAESSSDGGGDGSGSASGSGGELEESVADGGSGESVDSGGSDGGGDSREGGDGGSGSGDLLGDSSSGGGLTD